MLSQYLSHWESEAIDGLAKLVDSDALVCFPFFANTLPLAFHYAQALVRAGRDPSTALQLYEWGTQRRVLEAHLENEDDQRPLILYASAVDTFTPSNIETVDIGTYVPGAVFSEMNLTVRKEVERLNRVSPARDIVNIADIAPMMTRTFHDIEVFSDIPPQAEALLRPLLEVAETGGASLHFYGTRETIGNIFGNTPVRGRILRLFLYGGPMTLYMTDKTARYIPFTITPTQLGEAFHTIVAIAANDDLRSAVHNAVSSYHCRLMDAAKAEMASGTTTSFRAIQYHYNRLARLLAHRSSFPSSREYAKCIVEHQAP